MNDDLSWIIGLMRQNRESVGFIPDTTVSEQYIKNGRYSMQRDECGHNVGYLLHGKPVACGLLVVSQHCIDMEKRLRGYGEQAFQNLLERARIANCRGIKLRCAEGLESNGFWQAQGLELVSVQHPDTTRHRGINVYLLDLWKPLWVMENEQQERKPS